MVSASLASWEPRDVLLPEKSYARTFSVLEVPDLVRIQLDSYRWFQEQGLTELFAEISPITDFTGRRLDLRFVDYYFGQPKYSEQECRNREQTYAVPLRVRTQLIVKETGEIKEQELFFGDIPLMTEDGTFIINGSERVVVSQLVRSPGVYFTVDADASSGRDLCYAKLIPNRGAWLEFETSNKDLISVKVDRKRRIPITTLLRAAYFGLTVEPDRLEGVGTDEELLALFADADTHSEHQYIRATLERETTRNAREALIEFYRRVRPGDPPNLENARGLIGSLFFNFRRYDLGRVGRYKLNKRLGLDLSLLQRVLTQEDLLAIVREIIRVNNGMSPPDDIDHLGNRRVRAVGELIQNQFRVGLLRMERVIKERMTITDPDLATPSALVNIRPLVATTREFFGSSQLSQFMDQTNPLAELTHKRRLSALGPGGLSRDRAGFDVRDVHHSHYGRICPIETPEGPNIGLIGSLATYARVNEFGFLETPYRRVLREIDSHSPKLVGRRLREAVTDASGKTLVGTGEKVTPQVAQVLAQEPPRPIKVEPCASDEVEYLSADLEEHYTIAQANSPLDESGHFTASRVEARRGKRFIMVSPDQVDYMDISTQQITSVATALIPFLEHDDANRALMGSNMQRQALPLIRPEAPLVGTGMERQVARDSGQVVLARRPGVVTSVSSYQVVVREDDGGERVYSLRKFVRTNQGTCINQRVRVRKGQRVAVGQVVADSSATDQGELALGQNVICAFLSWGGYNFEDAIIISEELLKEDKFTSIHIEKHEVEARDTKLGPEEITRDIPNVGEESLRDLDEEGVIRVGAKVGPGDILVGKITPKGETELTAEEKLLRAIFGEKAREVKDTSLRVPHGERGKVIDVRVFSRQAGDELPPGVNKAVRVAVAQRRKIAEGDKVAGRHGNKGVVARILPAEEMPFLENGTSVEIILNPISVPSRMNVGQVLESHLGWGAYNLGFRAVSPVFDGAREPAIEEALALAWLLARANGFGDGAQLNGDPAHKMTQAKDWLAERGYDGEAVFSGKTLGLAKEVCLRLWLEDVEVDATGMDLAQLEAEAQRVYRERGLAPPILGKMTLYDGRTGEPFDQPVMVGNIYMMKLIHLVEDKIHARSTGPYSLITQQPLGGKAQFGGQRFGEMEVWALEAYGAAHVLQEMLTVKSDDVVGRVKTYEAIVKGENISEPGVPESFKVLVKEFQSLGLAVEVLNEDEEKVSLAEASSVDVPDLGINLTGLEDDYLA